jgi:hypothetical protein
MSESEELATLISYAVWLATQGVITSVAVWVALRVGLRQHYRWIKKREAEAAGQALIAKDVKDRTGEWPGT